MEHTPDDLRSSCQVESDREPDRHPCERPLVPSPAWDMRMRSGVRQPTQAGLDTIALKDHDKVPLTDWEAGWWNCMHPHQRAQNIEWATQIRADRLRTEREPVGQLLPRAAVRRPRSRPRRTRGTSTSTSDPPADEDPERPSAWPSEERPDEKPRHILYAIVRWLDEVRP